MPHWPADPDADIEAGLGAGGAALGVAIAVGSLASSAIVALAPFPGLDPLAGPAGWPTWSCGWSSWS